MKTEKQLQLLRAQVISQLAPEIIKSRLGEKQTLPYNLKIVVFFVAEIFRMLCLASVLTMVIFPFFLIRDRNDPWNNELARKIHFCVMSFLFKYLGPLSPILLSFSLEYTHRFRKQHPNQTFKMLMSSIWSNQPNIRDTTNSEILKVIENKCGSSTLIDSLPDELSCTISRDIVTKACFIAVFDAGKNKWARLGNGVYDDVMLKQWLKRLLVDPATNINLSEKRWEIIVAESNPDIFIGLKTEIDALKIISESASDFVNRVIDENKVALGIHVKSEVTFDPIATV